MSFLRRFVDERFLMHRLRSTSNAGIASAALAIVLFEYRYLRQHVFDWALLSIGLIFVAIKLTLMLWYRRTS